MASYARLLPISVVGAVSFVAIASRAWACDMPALPLIPASEDLGDRAPEVRTKTSAYFEGMRTYVACVQAELAAAGGNTAPASVKAVLVLRNNAAVAEAEVVQKLFEGRVGGGQTATPGTDTAVRKVAEGLMSGMPDYDSMTPELVGLTRQLLGMLQADSPSWAPSRASSSAESTKKHDIYRLRHERGSSAWRIGLNPEGKVTFATVESVESNR